MSNHVGHSDRLGSSVALHGHSDGQRSLSNDALAKAILFQLGKLGSGKRLRVTVLIKMSLNLILFNVNDLVIQHFYYKPRLLLNFYRFYLNYIRLDNNNKTTCKSRLKLKRNHGNSIHPK